jgi:membrane peptidoglycan carboxypeptidase
VWGAGFHLPAGGKTGTTNDGTNVWFIGYTADIVAGVWMGFDKPQKIKTNAQGGILAAPAWTSFMTEVYKRKPPPPDWPRPVTIVTRAIDATTGLLASPSCPANQVYTEFFIAGTEPTIDCAQSLGVPGANYIPTPDTMGRVALPPPGDTGGLTGNPLHPTTRRKRPTNPYDSALQRNGDTTTRPPKRDSLRDTSTIRNHPR